MKSAGGSQQFPGGFYMTVIIIIVFHRLQYGTNCRAEMPESDDHIILVVFASSLVPRVSSSRATRRGCGQRIGLHEGRYLRPLHGYDD